MSQKGGCFCDKVRISYTGEASAHVLCHCLDCKKISGAIFSSNFIFPQDNFEVESGAPKTISKVADTGKTVTSHFCGDCGTTLYRTSDTFPQQIILKVGVMDDPELLNKNVPKSELFAPRRASWQQAVKDAAQVPTMQ
ncbi:Mss4-like protein [Calycina marina]|uniref:Mss4-like protein n=1 Tax=Calycina marina TaxID=1763456 RepID=A0A9P8CE28_9HELO|nr:Mss4-like protein [Calycina marina]